MILLGLGRHTWGSRRTMTDSGISVVSGQSQLPTNANKTREEYVYFVLIFKLNISLCVLKLYITFYVITYIL